MYLADNKYKVLANYIYYILSQSFNLFQLLSLQ